MEENNENQAVNMEAPKKGNKKIIILIACIVGVLAITVGALAMSGAGGSAPKGKIRGVKGTPEEVVYGALLNTQEKLVSEMA